MRRLQHTPLTPANTARLEQALAAFPDARIQTRDEFKDSQVGDLKAELNIIYALLSLSVIVSMFGVINTLVLTVLERTREIGMLRAVGMTRRQLRRMVRHESIVTALIGAALGMAVGIFLAGLTTLALSDYGLVLVVWWKNRVNRNRSPGCQRDFSWQSAICDLRSAICREYVYSAGGSL